MSSNIGRPFQFSRALHLDSSIKVKQTDVVSGSLFNTSLVGKSVLLIAMLAFCFKSTAQEQSREQRIAAVMSIINFMLLDVDTFISLDLNKLENGARSVNKDFEIEFASSDQDLELCFYVNPRQAISDSNVTMSINGVTQSAGNSLTAGENCYTIPLAQQQSVNSVQINVSSGQTLTLSGFGVEPATQNRLGLPSLTRSSWDERAVRKVLKIFAFGGHATNAQIYNWANMRPQLAISQMLTFDQHNARLSPLSQGERYTELASQYGTINEFYDFIGSPTADHPIPVSERDNLDRNGYRFASTFGRMVAMRGLNPFRQRIGFWETNYHLATNRNAGVSRDQMLEYYRVIMDAHERRVPYHEVMGVAAKSAAVAMQYGHRRNTCSNAYFDRDGVCQTRLVDGESACQFQGNADFGREIFQLFFGIFGINDPTHEDVNIENASRMLTGMNVPYIEDFGFDTKVTFENCRHHKDQYGPLMILGNPITGFDASAKIDNLMPILMDNAESKANLPVYIISSLADDSMTDAKRTLLRQAWEQLGSSKDFLTFIHAYATSQMFHSPDHVKYLTSFERAYYLANKYNIDNIEAFLSNDYVSDSGRAGREIDDVMSGDNASEVFEPLHNVFGGQTSLEASDSAVAFEKNYNRSATKENWQFEAALPSSCDACDQGDPWSKDWTKVIPAENGAYSAEYVARWLWNHAVGNMDNYTELERAQLLSILGAVRQAPVNGEEPSWQIDRRYTYFDLNTLLCIRADRQNDGMNNNSLSDLMEYDSWDDYCRHNSGVYDDHELAALNMSFSGNDLQNSNSEPFPYLRGLMQELASAEVPLTSTDPIQRRRANESVQAALAFIFATPFIFAEGQ